MKTQSQKGKEHEQHVMDVMGGSRSSTSGARWYDKGDVGCPPFRISCKSRIGKSIRVERKHWEEICDQAYERGLYPAMAIRITDEHGRHLDLGVIALNDLAMVRDGFDF